MIPLCLLVTSDFPWLTCFLSPHSPDLLLCLILRCKPYFSSIEETHLKAPRRPVLHVRKQWKHLLSSSLFLLPGFLGFFVYFFVSVLFLSLLFWVFCFVFSFTVEQGRMRIVLGGGKAMNCWKAYVGAITTWENVELTQGKWQKNTSGPPWIRATGIISLSD